MNNIPTAIALGFAVYVLTAVGLWFVLSLSLSSTPEKLFMLIPAACTLLPLFISGYITSKYTATKNMSLRITSGIIPGILGFAISLLITSTIGETWFMALLVMGAIATAFTGALLGAKYNAL